MVCDLLPPLGGVHLEACENLNCAAIGKRQWATRQPTSLHFRKVESHCLGSLELPLEGKAKLVFRWEGSRKVKERRKRKVLGSLLLHRQLPKTQRNKKERLMAEQEKAVTRRSHLKKG